MLAVVGGEQVLDADRSVPQWLVRYTRRMLFDLYTAEDMRDFVVADREQS